MRTMMKRATRDRLTQRHNDNLSDGIGGTITGGPMQPIHLIEFLERGAGCVTRGGAVSGAAQVVVGGLSDTGWRDRGIALSDGSRINFSSIADIDVLEDDAGGPPLPPGRWMKS